MTSLEDLEQALDEGRKRRRDRTDTGAIADEPPSPDGSPGPKTGAPPAVRGDESDGPAAPSEGGDRAQ